jgi:precorrin-6A/cobalt-precorrin-6A reductase
MMVNQGLSMPQILILGGTTEASALAAAVAAAGLPATLSYAGRVANPRPQPVPTRTGGFGGTKGLVRYLTDNAITHLIDATHPFAAEMSAHAVEAATATGTPLIALQRQPWFQGPGDRWTNVPDIAGAVQALACPRQRVFLAIGRQHLAGFANQPQHHYLLRLVDPPEQPVPLPDTTIIIARGPFTKAGDIDLLQTHGIETIVAKNAGGTGADAKLSAARMLNLSVVMIGRPTLPDRQVVESIEEVMDWLHQTDRSV